MTAYRAGQRVRAEWPDGSAVEGVCEWRPGNDLVIPVGDIVVGLGALLAKDCTITILAGPRPEEPTGLGAVVEAAYADHPRQKWISNRGDADGPRNRWTSIPYWGFLDWDCLIDPVVLHEGWTP